MTDPNVEDVAALLKQRAEVGLLKYGTTTADAGLGLREWLWHALEETMDKAVYLRAAIRKIDSMGDASERKDEGRAGLSQGLPSPDYSTVQTTDGLGNKGELHFSSAAPAYSVSQQASDARVTVIPTIARITYPGDTPEQQFSDAGCDLARTTFPSDNSRLSTPVGSNPRTLRAPPETNNENNKLPCANDAKTAYRAPPNCGEISYNESELMSQIRDIIYAIGMEGATSVKRAEAIFDLFRPYLRTTEPDAISTRRGDANYWKTRYLLLEQKTKATIVAQPVCSEINLKTLRAEIVKKWREEADFAIKGGTVLTADEELDLILDMVRPYLRSPVPVSIDIDAGARAIQATSGRKLGIARRWRLSQSSRQLFESGFGLVRATIAHERDHHGEVMIYVIILLVIWNSIISVWLWGGLFLAWLFTDRSPYDRY